MPTRLEKHSNQVPAALSSHFMRNWARSTVIWCSLHWHHHTKWVPTVWACQMCVNGGVWEAVVQSDLTPVTPAHPDKWESMLGAHEIQLNKMAAIFCSKSSSYSLNISLLVIDFFWSQLSLSGFRAGLTCLSAGPGGDWRAPSHQQRYEGTRVWMLRASAWVECS